MASGRRTLKEHEAFAEGVLSGEVTVPERRKPSWQHVGAAGLLAVGAFALGFVVAPDDGPGRSRMGPQPAAEAGGAAPKTFKLPPEQKLALDLVRARQKWIDATTVTREQRLNAGEVADGFCMPLDQGGMYKCILTILDRRPQIPKELLERGQIPERPRSELEFALRAADTGCWHAWVTVDGARSDPSRGSDLRGCVVS